MPTSVHAADATDTRLLLAGALALLALVVYLAVAFANTNGAVASARVDAASAVAPWSPSMSKLTPVRRKKGGFEVLVTPSSHGRPASEHYGAIVQTLVPDPEPGRRYVVGLWLKASPPGRLGFELNEFRQKVARYPVNTMIRATSRWHHYTFSTRVKGTWLGLAVYVYRPNGRRRTSFSVRGVTAAIRGR